MGAGPLEVAFTFEGGEDPSLLAVALVGDVTFEGRSGAELDADCEGTQLDGVDSSGPIRLEVVLEALLLGLSDLSAWAEVFPDGELLVKFQHGVQVAISANATVRLEGASLGSPGSLRLSEPLVLSVDGEGLRLSHRRFHRLASLADIRIEGASLHPDGEVTLRGGANTALDRVVRGGLKRAGARLSELVKRSPRFARVRSFLRPE
ncbi:MAG: hypothetical protein R3F61_12185 [Myxococcota bacterium]